MDRTRKKLDLEAKLEQCRRLASQIPDGVDADNLRELAAELERKIRAMDEGSLLIKMCTTSVY
jgi:hypothetical protein